MAEPKAPPVAPLNPNDPGASAPKGFPNPAPVDPLLRSTEDVVRRIQRDHAPGWKPAGY